MNRPAPSPTWHYTCDHSEAGIRESGLIQPNHHPLILRSMSWFTDLGPDRRYEAGLTSSIINCDRMAYRFEVVDPAQLTWWPVAARALRVPQAVRDELEDGRLPAHWWIALAPVEVKIP
jgi:hypothetical protein